MLQSFNKLLGIKEKFISLFSFIFIAVHYEL